VAAWVASTRIPVSAREREIGRAVARLREQNLMEVDAPSLMCKADAREVHSVDPVTLLTHERTYLAGVGL